MAQRFFAHPAERTHSVSILHCAPRLRGLIACRSTAKHLFEAWLVAINDERARTWCFEGGFEGLLLQLAFDRGVPDLLVSHWYWVVTDSY